MSVHKQVDVSYLGRQVAVEIGRKYKALYLLIPYEFAILLFRSLVQLNSWCKTEVTKK